MSILDSVSWTAVAPVAPDPEGLPTVTHEGTLEIFDHKLRCYRLNDGRAIIHADDFRALFGSLGIDPASAVHVDAASTSRG
jgi:hypothetical protein